MMTEGTKKRMKAVQEMKLNTKPTISEAIKEIKQLGVEMQSLKAEMQNATEVIYNLKLLVMDLAEMVSMQQEVITSTHRKGIAATLQEIIANEHEVWENLPTIDSESIGGTTHATDIENGIYQPEVKVKLLNEAGIELLNNELVVAFTPEQSEKIKEAMKEGGEVKVLEDVVISPELEKSKQQAVDFTQVEVKLKDPIDEFDFDFFDVASGTSEAKGEELGTNITTTDAVTSATGDVEEFDPLASW